MKTSFVRKPDRLNLTVILLYAITHNVEFIPVLLRLTDHYNFSEGRDELMYINISIPNRTSSTDTDDDILPTSSKINQNPTMTCANIRDVNSGVKVEDLKGYIGRKQINEGLKEEYQVISV